MTSTTDLDAVYEDRNRLVLLAACLAVEAGYDVRWGDDPAAPDWPVVYIQLPTGQVSWHVPLRLAPVRQPAGGQWDGHTAQEKAARILRFVRGEEVDA